MSWSAGDLARSHEHRNGLAPMRDVPRYHGDWSSRVCRWLQPQRLVIVLARVGSDVMVFDGDAALWVDDRWLRPVQ